MELIVAILQGVATAREAAHAGAGIYQWVSRWLDGWGRQVKPEAIRTEVGNLARVGETEVRAAVDRSLAGAETAMTPAQREELIGILINLTRGARFLATHGQIRSGFLRDERMLDQLLKESRPEMRWGDPVAPGQPWVLQRYLGMGSFGEVWMARNKHHPTPRAYKFFVKENAGESLRKEQRNLVALVQRLGSHPRIIGFLDVVVTGTATPFLALEYLGGGSLEDWIVADPAKRAAIDKRRIIRDVVSALAAAHQKRIAHRDLKPANILLTDGPEPVAKVADFGLARVAASTREANAPGPSIGGVVGTSLYLPPEAQGGFAARSSFQDDIFAIGVIWYQVAMDTLDRPPYDFADALRARDVDARTIALIGRCLAHPDRRYPNASALEVDIDQEIPEPVAVPPGRLDVQHLAIAYIASTLR